VDDNGIRLLVRRLSRPHASGGKAVERSVILAEGTDSAAIIEWILAHSGVPDSTAPTATRSGLHGSPGGLHGSRVEAARDTSTRPALRYVLPEGAFAETPTVEPTTSE
jgi:hypothetical protein